MFVIKNLSLVAWLPERCVGVKETVTKTYPKPQKIVQPAVSHMFSIWEHHYSHGICFGTVYALQNSTPNILSFFRL